MRKLWLTILVATVLATGLAACAQPGSTTATPTLSNPHPDVPKDPEG